MHFQFGMLTAWKGPPTTRPSAANRRPPKGTVFILHGIGDRKDKVPYLLWARVLAQAGYARCWSTSAGTGGRPGGT